MGNFDVTNLDLAEGRKWRNEGRWFWFSSENIIVVPEYRLTA